VWPFGPSRAERALNLIVAELFNLRLELVSVGTSLGSQLQAAVAAVTTAYQAESTQIGLEIQAGLAAIAAAVANSSTGIDPTDAATITASITTLTALATQMQTDTATLASAFPAASTTSTPATPATPAATASKVAVKGDGGGLTAAAATAVAPAVAAKILLSPTAASIPLHTLVGGQQFVAKVIGTDGTDLHEPVTWGVTPTSVAEINQSGMATAKGVGTATITAQVGALTAFATLTVA